MRVPVLYCHPVETCYNAALHAQVLHSLRAADHEVDDCELYAEDFNPVMSREERTDDHLNTATPARLDAFRLRVGRAMGQIA